MKKYETSYNIFNAVIEQGTITASGNLDSDTRIRTQNYIDIDTTTYTLSWTGTNIQVLLYIYDENNAVLYNTNWLDKPATITFENNDKKIRCVFRYNSNVDITPNDISNVMMNNGSTALPYEPPNSNVWHSYTPQIYNNGWSAASGQPKKYNGGWS